MQSKVQKKIRIYSLITSFLIVISLIYRIGFIKKDEDKLPQLAKNKTVVTVFTRQNADSSRLKKDIEKYNAENKTIYIDYRNFDEDYTNLLRLYLQSENRPDIFQLGFYDIVEKGKVYTLDEIDSNIDEIDNKRRFIYKGNPIGIKVSGATVKLVWNKDIFKKSGLNPDIPPKTWGELFYFAKKIKEANKEIVPFEFPASSFGEIKISIGEPSVSKGSIYASFWDYKNGEYNFNYAKDIIKRYNVFYSEDIIPKDFNLKNIKQVRQDFIEGKTAMAISTSDDEEYFKNYLNFNIGISDLPNFYGQKEKKYYFTSLNVLVVYKNENDLNSVISVYKWLYNEYEKLNKEKIDKKLLPYSEYNNMKYFDFEGNDPTGSLSINYAKVNELIYQGINGNKSVNDVIKELNNYFNSMKDAKISKEPDFLNDYIYDKE